MLKEIKKPDIITSTRLAGQRACHLYIMIIARSVLFRKS